MPEDVLRVTTTVDLAPLVSGMNTAASTVEASTNRMNAAFLKVSGTNAQVEASLLKTAAAARQQGAAATEDAAQIKALQEQITILNAKLVELEEKLARAPKRGGTEFTEARHAIMGVGEEIGVRLPRFVTTFLSHLEGVAPIMAAAFSAVAVIGIIQAIPELINKIFEMTDALAGWDAEAKKAYANQLEMNRQLYMESLKTAEKHNELATIGLTGQKKLTAEADATRNNIKMLGEQLGVLNKGLMDTQNKSDDIHKSWMGLLSIETWKVAITGIDETKDALERQKKMLFEVTQQAKEYHDALTTKIPVEQAAEAITEQLATARATADAMKTVQMASLSFQEQSAREMLSMGIISRAQEVEALRNAEEQKYEVEKAYIARRKALALEEQTKTGKSAAPELATLEAERESLEVTHQAKMSTIVTTGELERRRIEDEMQRATIEGDRRVADARVSLEEETARELRASRKISIDEETARLKTAENDRYAAETAAINKELDLAKKYPEKNAAQIITMQKQLEASEIAHQAKMQGIDAAGDAARLSESRRALMEQVRFQQESANIQLEVTRNSINHQLAMHQIGLSDWLNMSKKAINTWYNDQVVALNKELEMAKKVYGENSIEYKKLIDRLRLLNMQYEKNVEEVTNKAAEKWKKVMTTMQDELNNMLSRTLTGYESFSKAWASLWEQMSTNMVKNLLKMMEQELVALLTHKSIAKQEILVDAKSAAASTYKEVSKIPYVGPFLAPPAAAAAFAAVMAFGSFQRGGETGSSETMAHLHPREMVLGEHIATPLKAMLADYTAITGRLLPVMAGTTLSSYSLSARAATMLHEPTRTEAGGGSLGATLGSAIATHITNSKSSTRGNMHLHYSPTVHAYGGDFEDALMEHAAVIGRIMKKNMRDGWSPE